MPFIHPNSDLDPVEAALTLVRRIESESLDEAQVGETCLFIIEMLASRQKVAQQRIRDERDARLSDSRRELIRARVKGVKPAALPGGLVAPEQPLIPSRH